MQIIWHGQSCFEIIVQSAKSSQAKIIIDPFFEGTGLKAPKMEADILLSTRSNYNHNDIKAVSGAPSAGSGQAPFLISGPGEYEIKNVFIQGIASLSAESSSGKDKKIGERGENIIYAIEAEGLKLCHLDELNQKELTEEQLEKIGDIDILMVPVGGLYTLSAKEALKIMAQVEPKITVPMHYALPKLKLPAGGKLDGLDKFLKALGIKSLEPQAKLSIKQKELTAEEAKIIVLKP